MFRRWPVRWRIYRSEALTEAGVATVRGTLEKVRQTRRDLDTFQAGLGTQPGLR